MQVTPKEILTEEKLNDLGTAFADCVKELFKDTLPQAKITVYMRIPKYDDKGNMSSAFKYDISDDTVDEETLKEQMDIQHDPLRQCFLDKISPNKDREPGRDWVGYFGQVLTLKDEQPYSQGGRSSSQRLSGHPRSERSYRSFYHTGVSSETPALGVRVFDTSRISGKKLVLTLLNCGLNKR